ncbi:MAG TPA: hypothetical protein VL463_21590, partial [Kofleriaceae bacterium]|nr:hypothetical protein [Kofleriaceae bacterium]
LRIASAQALLDEIAALAIAPWTQAEAERWWKERAPSVLAAHRAAVAKHVAPPAITVDTARLDQMPEVRAARAPKTA